MILTLLLPDAIAAACDVRWIPVHGLEVGIMRDQKRLPTHSLLKALDAPCEAGQLMEVQWVPSFAKALGQPLFQPGDMVCLNDNTAVKPDDLVVYAHSDISQWSMQRGELKSLEPSMTCALTQVDGQDFSVLTTANGEAVKVLQQQWVSQFGQALNGGVEINPWGYVALPHAQILTASDAVAADAAEHLDTPSRQEKGIRAIGPNEAWLHFWGADPPHSDHWAPPEYITQWVELAAGWSQHCLAQGLGSTTQCALKIGDLAWLNPKLPDPLGHKTHFEGRCMDIRLFRNDESTYEAYWNRADDRPQAVGGYSQALTQAFVNYAHVHTAVDVFYFNDPNVTGVQVSRGHDDHLHLCLK